jgi:hypothetical protein
MTYKVNVHFSKTSKETMQDKMKRIILNEFDKAGHQERQLFAE